MRKYKSLLNQADLRQLRELADRYHETEKEYRAAVNAQACASRRKFQADCEVYRLESEQRKTAREMQRLIWDKILAPEEY